MLAMPTFDKFSTAISAVRGAMKGAGVVRPMRWQGLDVSKRPEAQMHEMQYVCFQVPMVSEELEHYRLQIEPNLPWADEHFEQERVSGQPINPGETWKKWPYGHSAAAHLDWKSDLGDQFNHSYAERYWPRHAGNTPGGVLEIKKGVPQHPVYMGIRHPYGDLAGVVRHLAKEPTTRQAYLPVWFPEDTGDSHAGRKPCTIGYHFMMRDRRLNVTYQIRSCDFVRHFRDDVYLTVRLLLWVLDECRKIDRQWGMISPGLFRMDIGSLHCFVNDHRVMYGAHP